MKELFNFCPLPGRVYDLAQVREMDVDGIELLVYEDFPDEDICEKLVTGVHLAYWPDWLDFWLGKKTNEKYGSVERWLSAIKTNILTALEYKPEYLVWHVSNSCIEEVFTMQYSYGSMQVVKEAACVFNETEHMIPDDTIVLFENLWHPGLRLTEPEVVDTFFSLINKKKAGIVLDTGHLMLTNKNLRQETQGVEYICKTVENLGAMKDLIKGVHLTNSLYDKDRVFCSAVPEQLSDYVLWERLSKLDRHLPFKECSFERLFDRISPDYLVHELLYEDFNELAGLIRMQQKCLKKPDKK